MNRAMHEFLSTAGELKPGDQIPTAQLQKMFGIALHGGDTKERDGRKYQQTMLVLRGKLHALKVFTLPDGKRGFRVVSEDEKLLDEANKTQGTIIQMGVRFQRLGELKPSTPEVKEAVGLFYERAQRAFDAASEVSAACHRILMAGGRATVEFQDPRTSTVEAVFETDDDDADD